MAQADPFPLAGKRIWVTGGSGFLGRPVLAELARRGAVALAPTSTECDLLDPGAAARFIREHRPQGVIHMAAKVGGIGANRRHPGYFFYTNLTMGLHLAEACRAEAVEKLLVLGTVCAYPKFCPVPFREDSLWDGYPEETNAPYGIAKKALLVQLQAYRQEYGTRGIFLLPVNLYGPGDHLDPENNHVIPALIRKFLEARAAGAAQVELWGTGSAFREFLHVDDLALACLFLMETCDSPELVNVGCGHDITIRGLAELIGTVTGFAGQIEWDSSKPDGTPRKLLDVSKLTKLGWQARIPLEEGIRSTYQWWLKSSGASQ